MGAASGPHHDLVAGAKGDVVVKVFGDDLTAMSETADRIRRVIQQIDGAADVKMEMPFGLPSVNVTADRGRRIATRSPLAGGEAGAEEATAGASIQPARAEEEEKEEAMALVARIE